MAGEKVDLLRRLAESAAEVASLARGLSDEQLRFRPSEDEWSGREMLVHLADCHRHLTAQALKMRDEGVAAVNHFDGAGYLVRWQSARDWPTADVLRELGDARTDLHEMIELTSEDDLVERKAHHPLWGEMTMLQLLRVVYRHDRQHIEQIIKNLDARRASSLET